MAELPHLFNVGDLVDHMDVPTKTGGTVVEIFEDWLHMRVTYKVRFSCSCNSVFCEDELKKAE